MNDFNQYVFIYKNSFNYWGIATNPVFIASHSNCIAIKRNDIIETHYNSIKEFMESLNELVLDKKTQKFMKDNKINMV